MLFDVFQQPYTPKNSLSWKKNSRFTAPLLVIRIIRSFILQKLFYDQKVALKQTRPEVHKKTLEAFEKYLVSTGKLDMELLKIYQKMVVRADALPRYFLHGKNENEENSPIKNSHKPTKNQRKNH